MSLPEPSHPRAEYVRDEKGKFASAESEAAAPGSHANPEMMNILRHIGAPAPRRARARPPPARRP